MSNLLALWGCRHYSATLGQAPVGELENHFFYNHLSAYSKIAKVFGIKEFFVFCEHFVHFGYRDGKRATAVESRGPTIAMLSLPGR